jgi:glycosyltransferase involved in cell wall biosynthesis
VTTERPDIPQTAMKKAYDTVFVTNIPAFYKLALYNRIAQHQRILVVFLREGEPNRNADFYKGERSFDSRMLRRGAPWQRLLAVCWLRREVSYRQLVLPGWDDLANWAFAYLSPKARNAVVIESSYLESRASGAVGWLKRLFLSRVAKAYCSGSANVELMKRLRFGGEVVVTRGVGLYRRIPQPAYAGRARVRNFLYVGRLSPEKSLELALRAFAGWPELTLQIVGYGPQEAALRAAASANVVFHGPVANEDLPGYYQQNDVLVLPSISEPWGLVVEEALNNGTPVLVSDRVGCAADVVEDGTNGVVFRAGDAEGFGRAVQRLLDPGFYNALRAHIARRDPEAIERYQVGVYTPGGAEP